MTRRLVRLAAGLVLTAAVTAGCGGGDSAGSDGSTPYVRPTGSPFGVTITGPDVAQVGQTVTATLTNTGRLPDGYSLVSDPQGAVTIAEPNIRLGAGDSIEVPIVVNQVPVRVEVQSISGGSGTGQAALSLGEQD